MASNVVSTTRYETDTQRLSGGVWTVGQNLYIDISKLTITNTSGNGFSNATFGTNGVIGVLDEAPASAGARLVLRLSASADQNTALKYLLRSTEL